MRNKRLLCLVECSMMVALAFGLSFVKLWQMPLGGSVTLCSMLPILLIAIKYGPKIGLATGFVYGLTQLAQGFIEGDISFAAGSFGVLLVAMVFDYIAPYTLLGIAGVFGKDSRWMPIAGMSIAVAARFICHYITGVTIWAQWCLEGWSAWIYSAAYNGGYLLPDFAICIAVAIMILNVKQMRKILEIK